MAVLFLADRADGGWGMLPGLEFENQRSRPRRKELVTATTTSAGAGHLGSLFHDVRTNYFGCSSNICISTWCAGPTCNMLVPIALALTLVSRITLGVMQQIVRVLARRKLVPVSGHKLTTIVELIRRKRLRAFERQIRIGAGSGPQPRVESNTRYPSGEARAQCGRSVGVWRRRPPVWRGCTGERAVRDLIGPRR